MKKRFAVACALASLAFLCMNCLQPRAHAQTPPPAPPPVALPSAARAPTVWFNVEGDASDPRVNTIDVDPSPITVNGPVRTMRVRVSRSAERTSWDGVRYRSYVSEVIFNCTDGSARYATISFYIQPGWRGQPYRTSIYSETEPRWMEFRDVEPNPTQRIIRAACTSGNVISN